MQSHVDTLMRNTGCHDSTDAKQEQQFLYVVQYYNALLANKNVM